MPPELCCISGVAFLAFFLLLLAVTQDDIPVMVWQLKSLCLLEGSRSCSGIPWLGDQAMVNWDSQLLQRLQGDSVSEKWT